MARSSNSPKEAVTTVETKPMGAADVNTFECLTPTVLARSFSVVLRQWLTHSEISETNTANAETGYDESACASHDYCDSNMAMLEAVSTATGVPVDDIDVDVSNVQFWERLNEAWSIAKQADFDPRRLSKP